MYTQTKQTLGKRWWDIPAILFLVAAIWVSVARLNATDWTKHLDIVLFLVLLGLIAGIFLGKSRFHKIWVFVFGLVFTLFFVPWQIISTIPMKAIWLDRLINAALRINAILFAVLHDGSIQDNLLFLTIMSLLYWLIALTAGYMLVRYGRPWAPLLVAGVALFVIDQYNPSLEFHDRYTIVYLVCLLSLVGRLYYLNSRYEWIDQGYTVDSETGFNLGRTILVGGLLVTLLAWNLPVLAESLQTNPNTNSLEFWDNLKNRASKAVAGLENPVVYITDSYSDRMGLGTVATSGGQTVFTVKAAPKIDDYRFYWRGNSFDFFDGVNWSSSIKLRSDLETTDWPLKTPAYQGRKTIELVYRIASATMEKVYLPNSPIYVNRPVEYIGLVVGNEEAPDVDMVGVLAQPSFHAGEIVQARASVSNPSMQQLEASGSDYPFWVRNRYLQLPENFSERIRQQAEEIAAPHATPYEKTVAITQFLRDEITYTNTIATPPDDVDTMEWFLFTYKQGFCNYYATAEVLMLRSLGIPARIVIGYAEGTYNEELLQYDVRLKDYHAWPEVYFPNIGWVEFEPTVSQPEVIFPDVPSDANFGELRGEDPNSIAQRTLPILEDDLPEPSPIEAAQEAERPFPWFLTTSLILGGVALLAAYISYRRGLTTSKLIVLLSNYYQKRGIQAPRTIRQLNWYNQLSSIERLFLRVDWMLWLLRKKLSASQTPTEKINEIIDTVPGSDSNATLLLNEYQKAIFSLHGYDLIRAKQAQKNLFKQVIRFVRDRILRISKE